jgi:hypothetical protein
MAKRSLDHWASSKYYRARGYDILPTRLHTSEAWQENAARVAPVDEHLPGEPVCHDLANPVAGDWGGPVHESLHA